MNILYCGDAGVCDGIVLSALSVCKNVKGDINFYILTANIGKHKAIPDDFTQNLETLLCRTNDRAKVFLFDTTENFADYIPTANMQTRFTPLCMLRLFADTVPEIPDKILYLDTDVMCCADFGALYNTEMGKSEIAGVPDRYGKWFFGNILRHDYLNSGVLLMDMVKIRKSGLFKKCRTMCREKRMFMPDQTALNKLAIKQKISVRYNEQGKIKKNTVFKHFTTFFRFFPLFHSVTVKPWQTDRMHNELHIFEFDDIIKEYNDEKRNTHIFYNR